MAVFQVNEKCNGCLACVQNCPAKALSYEDQGTQRWLLHNLSLCARCGHCWRICPERAIESAFLASGPSPSAARAGRDPGAKDGAGSQP